MFHSHESYGSTDIDWIGEIPSHWDLKRIAHHFEFITGHAFKSDFFEYDSGIKLIRGDNVTEGRLRWGDKTRCWPELTPYLEQFLLKSNDIVIGMDGSKVGKNFATIRKDDLPLLLVQRVARLRADKSVNFRFAGYLIGSDLFKIWVTLVKTDPAIPHISPDNIKKFPLPFPPLPEQQKIANFLDHETAKIDTLIEKQQQLIKLLKEKRQAVISHAVTKGLNPDAPMKDSGVEWLGEVPAGWVSCGVKYVCREITDGAHVSPDLENGIHYFVSITDVKKGVINFNDALLTSSQSFEYLKITGCVPLAGDILFSKDGTIGQTAITPTNIEFVVASSLIIIRPNNLRVMSEFLNYFLQSRVVIEQVESFVKGAALRRLSIQNLNKIVGCFPPLNEQSKISDYLNIELKKYDATEKSLIELHKVLVERRTALISAAVTGKIDVRNWQPPESSSTSSMDA